VLTRLSEIDGVQSSSALLADDGKRLVQVSLRPGTKETKVVEEVQRALRAAVQHETPTQLQGKSAVAVGLKQDWLTISQLNTLAAMDESSSRRFDTGYLLLAFTAFLALGVVILWLLRRRRSVRQGSGVRLDPPCSGDSPTPRLSEPPL
jgi:hypothetical protein